MNPRTLSVALQTTNLDPEAVAFVQAGQAKPRAELHEVSPVPRELPPVEEPITPVRPEPPGLHWNGEPAADPEAGLMTLSVRVPRSLPSSLLLASVDRKLKRQRPWTQQEIVAEALTAWLKQHGYLS